MAVRVSSSPTLSRPFVELFWKMLDFSTKWPTKFAGKVSKCRHNENCYCLVRKIDQWGNVCFARRMNWVAAAHLITLLLLAVCSQAAAALAGSDGPGYRSLE